MGKKWSFTLLLLALFYFAFQVPAHGQTGGSCFDVQQLNWWNTNNLGPGWSCTFNDLGFWASYYRCVRPKSNCSPPPSQCCPECNNCPKTGAPIGLADGNTYIEETDVRIPGLSNGLQLSRVWVSKWPASLSSFQVGLFGPNWRSSYEERIYLGSDNYIKYLRSDGSFWSFGFNGVAFVSVAPMNAIATLTVDSNNTNWTITFQNGEQRIFSYASGSLTSIIDRNGNATQITYDALNRPTAVTDPAGRHLYFGYPNNSSYLVTSLTSDVGISLSYAYDSQNRLSQVTKPDSTTISFAYDSNSNIITVTDSAGKVLESHTYDSQGRGLTSSRANGVEAVSVSYH